MIEYGVTSISALGMIALITSVLMILFSKRQIAILSLLLFVCFVPFSQRFILATLDLNLLRILVLFGLLRIFLRKQISIIRLNYLDYISIALAVFSVIFFTIGHFKIETIIFKLGNMFDSLGLYFLLRFLLRTWDDVFFTIGSLVKICFPVALFFIIEWMTGKNLFSVFGGVPEYTFLRNGVLRCQGVFNHPITASVFWGSLIPLFIAYRHFGSKILFNLGLLFLLIIVYTTHSSTGVMTILIGLIGVFFVYFRNYIYLINISIIPIVLFLHVIMKGPVWSILAKVNVLSSSTGWHRYYLIDMAIKHFDEWWLYGTPSTAHWGWGLWDITNQYVWHGVQGGLVSMLLFVGLVIAAFYIVHEVIPLLGSDKNKFVVVWALGATVLSFAVTFISISAYGQILFSWTLVIALLASIYEIERKKIVNR